MTLKTPSRFWAILISWTAFGLWFAVLCWLSSLPAKNLPEGMVFPHIDKVVHFGYFALGGFLVALAIVQTFPFGRVMLAVASFLFMLAIGILDEWRQTHTPGRSGADRGDMIADCAGALTGITFAFFIYGRGSSASQKTDRLPQQGDPAA